VKTKLRTLALSVLIVSAILVISKANGQTLQIAPEWEAHFKTTPVIENCVYERKSFLPISETSLFQFRYQENAFIFRQIRKARVIKTYHAKLNKLFIWGFVVLLAIALSFIWKRARQRGGS